MNKKIIAVFILLTIGAVGLLQAQLLRFRQYDKEVTLSSVASTQIAGYMPGRRYFLVVNINPAYDCLVSTYVLHVGDVNGKYIYNSGGHWEENYNLYTSSYYAIALSSGISGQVKVKVTEKE